MKKSLACIIAAFAALPAFAGVVYDVESTMGGTTNQATIAVEGQSMKMNTSTADSDWNGDMVFRGDRREMLIINHDDRTYFVLDQEQMRQMVEKLNQAMASMEQALAAVPASQRAQMEKMMKGRMPEMGAPREPSKLKKTGETDTVNGFACTVYEVWRSGVRERELCVTDWDNVAGGEETAEVFYSMAEFMTEMLDSLPKMGQGQSFGDATYEHMKEMNGFPVRTREFGGDGVLDAESSLKASRKADIDPADFEPPKKYKRKDLMKGMR